MNDVHGFFISELRIKGQGFSDVVVPFAPGLTVIAGPSDTGKSLILDAINFVFGGSKPLKTVGEQAGYSRIMVELTKYIGGDRLTLERAWSGGDVTLYQLEAASVGGDTPSSVLAWKHDPNINGTVSNLLLQLSGLDGFAVRTNARGKTRLISFRDVVEFTLVSEERIITTYSPIHSGQYIDKTVESSVFRVLLTGRDDSTIEATENASTARTETVGKRQILADLRQGLEQQIETMGRSESDLTNQARVLDGQLEEQSALLRNLTADTESVERIRAQLLIDRNRARARLDEVNGMLVRFDLLSRKYLSDMDRLLSNLEGGDLLRDIPEGDCPICGALPEHQRSELIHGGTDIDTYTDACQAEASKIRQLQTDLSSTVTSLRAEAESITTELAFIEQQILEANAKLRAVVQPSIAGLQSGLSELVTSRRAIDSSLSVYGELRRLERMEASVNAPTATQDSPKQQFEALEPDDYTEFARQVEALLTSWEYPELSSVEYESGSEDLVISGKRRADHGKGYRAITYAAFAIALLRLSRTTHLPHPGFVLINSPLVTYRQPDEDMGEGLKAAFYRDLAKIGNNAQVIVLENEIPPSDTSDTITLTQFTKSRTHSRYGLLPV